MDMSTKNNGVREIAALADPIRRQLFEFVSRATEPVGRDEASGFTGLPRSTTAFHLDRLVEAGLLRVEYSKLTGREGPGSGRPAKLYVPATDEVNATVPRRQYDVMGDILAAAIESAHTSGRAVRDTLTDAARARGELLGTPDRDLPELLESVGYEPEESADGEITLTNCPFHRLASSHTEIICQANVALIEGAADGCGDTQHSVRFDPASGRCCVTLGRK